MKLLITGASGVIGRELIPFLIDKGHSITGISRNPFLYNHPNFSFLGIDLSLLASENGKLIYPETRIREKFQETLTNTDGVVHLSGVPSGAGKTHEDYFLGNTKSVETLVKICETYGIQNFIYASSASVYGRSGIGREAKLIDPLLGETHYAISKIKGEEILRKSTLRFAKILRIASVYGRDFKSFINKLLSFQKRGFLPDPNKKKNLKSLIYYNDLLELVESALQFKSSGTFNIANPEVLEYGEIIKVLQKINPGKYIKIPVPEIFYSLEKIGLNVLQINRDPMLKPLFEGILMDTSESLKILGYSPKYTLEMGLSHMKL